MTRRQLLALGLRGGAIEQRLRDGRLHRLRRAVYLVGNPAPSPHAHEMGAVLACGDGAVLSHLSAARLWRLLPHQPQGAPIDVTVQARDPGRKPGIRVHQVRALDRREIRTLKRIPVTAPARTLLDLAAELPARNLEGCLAEAHARRLAREGDLVAVLRRNPRHRGATRLRSWLEWERPPALTRSEAEARLLELIRRAELPEPEVNARIGGYEVDFLWRSERLVVEVDGFQFHSSRSAFERDRLRDAELQARGLRVQRVTWRQITAQPEALLVRLAQALAAAA